MKSRKKHSDSIAGLATEIAFTKCSTKEVRDTYKMKDVKLNIVLARLMKQKRLSARSLSKISGIPTSTITSYCSVVKASYDPKHLASLAAHFDVSIDYLLFNESPATAQMGELEVQQLFEGLLRVKIEKVLTSKKRGNE